MTFLLGEATIDGTLHRISNSPKAALEHYWNPYIKSIDAPQFQLEYPYGGYERPGFGNVKTSRELFTTHWPPPLNFDLSLYKTETNEAAREFLFDGKAHFKGLNRKGVTYRLYGSSYSAQVASGVAFDDTLANVVAWFCDAARLNLTVDTTYARVPSPAVKFTTAADEMAINLLSGICAFFTHLFYIQEGTLYLVDVKADAGSRTITEFQFFPSEYEADGPVALAKTANFSRPSAYSYGREISFATEYHDTQANIEAALDDVIEVVNKRRCSLKIPLRSTVPTPGTKISWTDTAMGQSLSAYIRARTLRYDFDSNKLIVEGEGELSA